MSGFSEQLNNSNDSNKFNELVIFNIIALKPFIHKNKNVIIFHEQDCVYELREVIKKTNRTVSPQMSQCEHLVSHQYIGQSPFSMQFLLGKMKLCIQIRLPEPLPSSLSLLLQASHASMSYIAMLLHLGILVSISLVPSFVFIT